MNFRKFIPLTALLLFSCLGNSGNIPDPNEVIASPEAIIVNSLSETLSSVYGDNPRTIANNLLDASGNLLNTGSAPNQILLKNGLAYIVNSRSINLQVIDLEHLVTKTEISLGSGQNPYFMTFYGEDKIYISELLGSDGNGNVSVITINPDETYSLTNSIDMPEGADLEPFSSEPSFAKPQGITASNSKIYVTLTNLAGWAPGGPGFVIVIDPKTDSIIKKIKTSGLNPSYAYSTEFQPDLVYILHSGTFSGDGLVDVIDTKKDEIIATINTGGAPYSVTVTKNQMAYVTDALAPHLFKFDAATFQLLNGSDNPIPVVDPDKNPFNFISFIDVSKEGSLFALAFNSDELYILDSGSGEIKEGPYLVGDGPIAMVVDK